MKHVFVLHSPITYISAIGVCLEKGLPREDVLFLSDKWRYDAGPIPVKHIDAFTGIRTLTMNPVRYVRNILHPYKEFYQLIDSLVGDDSFIVYAPIMRMACRVLIVHPKCQSFCIIEEGTEAYTTYQDIQGYTQVLNDRWFYPDGIKSLLPRFKNAYHAFCFDYTFFERIPIMHNAYASNPNIPFYGMSEYSFPDARNRTIMSFQSILKYMEESGVVIPYFSGSVIWLEDMRHVHRHGVERVFSVYLKYLKECSGKGKIYVKFHPNDNIEHRKLFTSFLEANDISYSVMSDDVLLELVLMKAEKCAVYGVGSSLLFYAGLFGHDAYSIRNGFGELKEKVFDLDKVDVFNNIVKFI